MYWALYAHLGTLFKNAKKLLLFVSLSFKVFAVKGTFFQDKAEETIVGFSAKIFCVQKAGNV